MPHATSEGDLAINGGQKAVAAFEAEHSYRGPKVGLDEFLAIADTFGYSPEAQAKMRTLLSEEDESVNPQLTRYYNPRPSRVAMFEEKARQVFGSNYALGVNSGTSALMSAYVAAGVGPGTEVIVPAYTFYASAAAVVASKGIPVIAEINDTMTIDPVDVERKITPRTKAIVPVHMLGMAADMDAIMDIARRHNLMVIEDNAQACGGTFKGRYLGTIGDLGCFSLSSYKVIGAGEAGMVLTDDEWLYTRALSQHDTAACWRPDRYAVERRPGELFCGQNYRMSELEGAVNWVQMGRIEEQRVRYNANMRRIVAGLDTFARTRLRPSNDIEGDLGYCIILTAESKEAAGLLGPALAAEGLPAGARGVEGSRDWHIYSFWEQILEQKTATDEGCPFTCPYYEGPLPEYSVDMCAYSADLFDRAIFLRVNQWWTERDCDAVAAAVNKVCGVYG
ncbi:MAG: aminotransferase class I/II-fold pyridoxal phosphate-dependent enzyme [Anaerolineae bacterium]|nr:aminotransferase class I/II-fold pyridoxal phosphate-dependent enzyme [Anaerolineae bacterium]